MYFFPQEELRDGEQPVRRGLGVKSCFLPHQKVWRIGTDMIIRLFMELVSRSFSLQVAAVYLAPVGDRWFRLSSWGIWEKKEIPNGVQYGVSTPRIGAGIPW